MKKKMNPEGLAKEAAFWAKMKSAAKEGPKTVCHPGGEPFLRPDLFLILEEMIQQGFDLYLLSNGTLLDREKARRLSRLPVRGVQISLEGLDG